MYKNIGTAGRSDADTYTQTDKKSLSEVKPRYLKTPDAAIHLGLSSRTLEKHRCHGTGPVFRKLGGRVVYAIDDLDAWTALGARRSTSDPGIGIVHPAKRIVQTEGHKKVMRKR